MKSKDLLKLIPSSVRITPKVTYEVLWIDEFPNDHEQLGECRHDGDTGNVRQILIKKGQSNTEAFKTFIHEVQHALSYEYKNLNLTESQVIALEKALYNLLKLNKVLDKLT